MLETYGSDKDKPTERRFAGYSISALSAVLVLFGVILMIVGDTPVVPYSESDNFFSKNSDVWLPLCLPSSGKIPMITFLPGFVNTDDSDVSDGVIPENSYPVISLTLIPPASMSISDGVYINNEAEKNIDTDALIGSEVPIELKKDDSVQVIIYHTHGSESYNLDGLSYYGDDLYEVHTSDLSKNVVHIGQIITEKLREIGVGVVHDTTMYDIDGYNDAYDRSCEAVGKLLEIYPNVKLVLDIHRDTVVTSNGSKYRPVVEFDNKKAAQMMILVGTGKKSAPNNHWSVNLSVAIELQKAAESVCGNVMRPILLRNSGYNQHLSVGSLLVEIGTCGNSLEEAELAAEILGDAISNAFIKK